MFELSFHKTLWLVRDDNPEDPTQHSGPRELASLSFVADTFGLSPESWQTRIIQRCPSRNSLVRLVVGDSLDILYEASQGLTYGRLERLITLFLENQGIDINSQGMSFDTEGVEWFEFDGNMCVDAVLFVAQSTESGRLALFAFTRDM